jgi:hypothetical protein
MSSQRASEPPPDSRGRARPDAEGGGRERARARRPFETWRKIGLAGAVTLLVGSILDAALDDLPRIVSVLMLGTGWGLLAAGFGRAMLDRRRRAAQASRKS